jgi:hypothetical protein
MLKAALIDDGLPPFIYPLRAARHRTCLSGRLVYGGGEDVPVLTLDCAIRDISEAAPKLPWANALPCRPTSS